MYHLYHTDCLHWLETQNEASFEAIVTDPPYGLREFSAGEQAKLQNGNQGGIWRIPPSIGNSKRAPLPRFTVLTTRDFEVLHDFFFRWGCLALRIVVPGAHLLIATNPFVSHILYSALVKSGWEKRGEVVRLVQTFKGGDRPKNAEKVFPDVTVIPRSAWEPWGVFRKPLEGRVQDNLRQWNTGGLRRFSTERPFTDVIQSERTPRIERNVSPHPSLKPQRFMRTIVYASLPLGIGRVLDPFMGGGATVAAAEAVGYGSVGIEVSDHYFSIAEDAIPKLRMLYKGENQSIAQNR